MRQTQTHTPPTRIAIIESHSYPTPEAITRFIETLPADTLVVTGDTPTINRTVVHASRQRQLPTLFFRADWPMYGRRADIVRNEQIIDHADHVIAFCHGQSPETASAIRIARAAHKSVLSLRQAMLPTDLGDRFRSLDPFQDNGQFLFCSPRASRHGTQDDRDCTTQWPGSPSASVSPHT